MAHHYQANQDFERAIFRAFIRKVVSLLTGRDNNLLPFDAVRERLPIRGQHYLGLKQVPIDQIVGSLGRYHDFDRAFLPTQTRTKARWVSIDQAHYQQISLPPVELFKIGEIYFVKDGNHRVSVARERGQSFVDAYVIEIDVPIALTPDTRVDELQAKKEYAEFLLQTDLASQRPGAEIETRLPGQYQRLLEHISVHRWYLGEKRQADVPLSEAAASWYDHVYLPVVNIIRDQDFLKEFPGASEADLYLWIMEFQGNLRQAYNREDPKAEAGKELIAEYPHPAVKKLVNYLNRTTLIDELMLREERATFLEQTNLLALRPDARVETTLPGKYAVLREHIAVHRWYLGEQQNQEVPYPEAVTSWFDNVYTPVVNIIRESGVLEAFPGRTETDLYLWVIDHQTWLQEAHGSQVPLEQAAEQFAENAGGKRKD